MKTKLLGFAILVIMSVGCQQQSWKEFNSPEGQFSLLMPGIPVEKTDVENTPGGRCIRLHLQRREKRV